MEENEKLAYIYGGQMGGEYLDEIKKYNLAQLSKEEWFTFLECVCKNYHMKFIELEFLSQS